MPNVALSQRKHQIFASMFHYLFMFLPDFSLGEHFWSVKVPTYAKQMQFGSHFESTGVQKHALESHFWSRGL